MDLPASLPAGAALYLVAGDSKLTRSQEFTDNVLFVLLEQQAQPDE